MNLDKLTKTSAAQNPSKTLKLAYLAAMSGTLLKELIKERARRDLDKKLFESNAILVERRNFFILFQNAIRHTMFRVYNVEYFIL
jgi:hypothetical protein